MKVLVLGSTGMLGSQVVKYFSQKKNLVLHATYRSKKDLNILKLFLKKDFKKVKWEKFDVLNYNKIFLKKKLKNFKFIVNCIGIIKPNIDTYNNKSLINALKINSLFPHDLYSCSTKKNKILQIATDCVFDGSKGFYKEHFLQKPDDVYGKTKSLGEVKAKNFYNIRCSIIGKEIKSRKSLISWFLNQKRNAKIFGFNNHVWNGITTFAFAKIAFGIMNSKVNLPETIHIVPKNIVKKYFLLKLFKKKFHRYDISIKKINDKYKINRTLQTNYREINKKIWQISGYRNVPSVEQLIDEI